MNLYLLLRCAVVIFGNILLVSSTTLTIFAIATEKDLIYIVEWLEYHQLVGFDHIYLLDTTLNLDFIDIRDKYEGFVTILQTKSVNAKKNLETFTKLFSRNDTVCSFLEVNEFLVLSHHQTVHQMILDKGVESLSVLPTFDVISRTVQYYPDFILRRATMRSVHPVSVRYSGVLSNIASFEADLKPVLVNDVTHDEPSSFATVYRVSLLSETEHRWYVEWLCADYQRRQLLIRSIDSNAHSQICSEFPSAGVSDHSTWRRLVSNHYSMLRKSYYEEVGLTEDTKAWHVLYQNLSFSEIAFNTLYPAFDAEDIYQKLFLSSAVDDQHNPEEVLGSFVFTPLQEGGEEASTMTVYGDRDVPLQFLQFCVDHTVTDCSQLTNYAMPSFVHVLEQNPRFLAGTKERNTVNYAYVDALLYYYTLAMRRDFANEMSLKLSAIHKLNRIHHPEECYRGWRVDERMLRDYVDESAGSSVSQPLPSFVMYVLHHDNASLQLVNDALFEGDPVANSNGLIVPVAVQSSVFFEYIAYRDVFPERYLRQWSGLDYVGITTYKTVVQYSTLCTYEVERVLRVAAEKGYDVIPFVRSNEELLSSAVLKHRRSFRYAWDALLMALGYDLAIIRSFDRIKPFFRNSMLIKPDWLRRLSQFMSRAVEVVQFNITVHRLCSAEAGYDSSNEEVARRVFNSSSYKLFPFLFERLPSFYLAVEGAVVCQDNEDCPTKAFW